MKNLRQFCAAVLLCAALAVPALADCGDVSCGLTSTPPPPSVKGDMNYPVTQLAVSFIQTALSLS
jgi:hypothetical protein